MTDEEGKGGELIRFPKAPDDAVKGPLEIDDPRRRFEPEHCKHPRPLALDSEAHALVCKKCGQHLDIFDFLFELTGKWERFNVGYRQARQQERAALGRVENLKRVEGNAKARIRKLGYAIAAGDARVARDQLRACRGLVTTLLRELYDDDQEKIQRALALHGVRRDDFSRAYRALNDAVELRDAEGDDQGESVA